MTLHRWSGVADGRYDLPTLLNLITTLSYYEDVRERISRTDVLIIDEISMISLRVFDHVEAVCRAVRKSDELFGGLQVVLAGDFLQLAPVPNHHLPDSDKHAFLSARWNFHHVNLTKVIRQTEIKLIECIHELATGTVSTATETFLKSLSRPLAKDEDPTVLYGTRDEAMFYNLKRLSAMPETEVAYKAVDTGRQKLIDRYVTAPKTLRLKTGAKVMLLKNLSDRLVNGLQGAVQDTSSDGPTVHFDEVGITMKLEQQTFSVYGRGNTILGQRKQFPLALSYAITAHKAQGLTLPAVIVDCKTMRQAGQVGVAVGRAMTIQGLQVINFRRSDVRTPSMDVLEFSVSHSCKATQGDFSCCRQVNGNKLEKLSFEKLFSIKKNPENQKIFLKYDEPKMWP